ncbi:MAG: hypothetical protein QM687_06495 [Ferruginibacter sp.]
MKKLASLLIAGAISFSLFPLYAQNNILPAEIVFERKVVQETKGEEAPAVVTYNFTASGDYVLISHKDKESATEILYTKDGRMCMVDEEKKTITMMSMPKMLTGIGSALDKSKIKPGKNDEEKMTVTKTGKTKTICGFPAYEYVITADNGGKSSWWYAQVDFNPIKIYTMGAGNSDTDGKIIAQKEEMKNNPMAIPVINKNYLLAEIEMDGKKGMETKSITREQYLFSTTGYTIKEIKGFGHN